MITIQIYFKENNFVKIKEYYREFVDEIFIEKSEQNIQTRSPFVTNSVSKLFYKELHKNQANGEISWYLKGTYVWDRATGRMTSTSNGTIIIDRINFGQSWTGTVNNMRTKSWLDEEDTRANFSGSFNLKAEMKQNHVTIFSVDFGTLSCQVSGQPHE